MDLLQDNPLPLPVKAYTRDRHSFSAATASELADVSLNRRSTRENHLSRDKINSTFVEMTMTTKPTPKIPQDRFLKYFLEHNKDCDEDADCVFLLWGPLVKTQPDTCSILRAIDVPIKRTGGAIKRRRPGRTIKRKVSEDKVFLDMRRDFYKHTKSWATHLRLRTISAVKPIKFRLIETHEPGFLVSALAVDFSAEREECQRRLDEVNEQLEEFNSPERWTHEEWINLKSRIDWIDSTPCLTYYFLHPDAAKDQVIISRDLIYKYRGIECLLQSADERRTVIFDGLYIEEQWRAPRAIALVITILFITCMVSRLIWKSWEIVFGAASFVATAIMLALAMHDS